MEKDEQPRRGLLSRRTLLTSAVAASVGGLVGGYVGYRQRRRLSLASDLIRGKRNGRADFHLRAGDIEERHNAQTTEDVAALKAKYDKRVFGKEPVWDLLQKLARCVDVTDTRLYGTSQLVHVGQALATMEAEGVDDPDMHLIAILHDLGKVMLLTGEAPENVLCGAGRMGEYEPGVGLDNMVFQFCHPELIYTRIKDHVPEHVAFACRYHNLDLDDVAPYMTDRDRRYVEKYVVPFKHFDDTKSLFHLPELGEKYRDLIETTFPKPISF